VQHQTVQPPPDAGRAPGADEPRPEHPHAAARPVFLDPSGRRQRRVRRLGRLLAIPAAAYVALLLSTALGGPSVDSPYLPLPAAGDHHTGGTDTGHRTPGTAEGGPGAGTKRTTPTTGSPAGRPTTGTGTGGASPHPSAPGATSAPASPGATASTAPSATAVPTVTHGRSTATHPVPTHTGHGHG